MKRVFPIINLAMPGYARALLFFALLALSGCKLWTVRPIGWQEKQAATQQLDPAAYVESVWQSKVIPTITEKAADLATTLARIDGWAEVKAQHSVTKEQDAAEKHFLVKGEAVVTRVDVSSPRRTLTVKVPKYKGQMEVVLQIGPVIRGTALRDAVGFIKFEDFVNQMQYAEVSTKLHERIFEFVTKNIEPSALMGKTITFSGAFTVSERERILLTPVSLERKQ